MSAIQVLLLYWNVSWDNPERAPTYYRHTTRQECVQMMRDLVHQEPSMSLGMYIPEERACRITLFQPPRKWVAPTPWSQP